MNDQKYIRIKIPNSKVLKSHLHSVFTAETVQGLASPKKYSLCALISVILYWMKSRTRGQSSGSKYLPLSVMSSAFTYPIRFSLSVKVTQTSTKVPGQPPLKWNGNWLHMSVFSFYVRVVLFLFEYICFFDSRHPIFSKYILHILSLSTKVYSHFEVHK